MATQFLGKTQKVYRASIRRNGTEFKKVLIVAPSRDAALSKLRSEYRGQSNITWHLYKDTFTKK